MGGENGVFTRRNHEAKHGDSESAKCVWEVTGHSMGLRLRAMLYHAKGSSLNFCKYKFTVK